MSSVYLSYLMGADEISDQDLIDLGIETVETTSSGDKKLKIPIASIEDYSKLIRTKMTPGFWNEFIGQSEIRFIFRLKTGEIKEYILSPDNELEIDKLCAEFNNETLETTVNVYKWLSNNSFYHDFMFEHYRDLIERQQAPQASRKS